MTTASPSANHIVNCRFCGGKGTPHFCGTCGLPLGDVSTSLFAYIYDRLRAILMPVPRFVWTTALLLRCPRLFFSKLNEDGFGLHQITIGGAVDSSARFSHCRRPTTPQNYFLYATTFVALYILAVRPSGSESRDDIVGRVVDAGTTGGWKFLIEILAIPMVFSLYYAYRRILCAHDKRALIEYVLYIVGLLQTAGVAFFSLLLLAPRQLGLFAAVGGMVLLVFLHIYYCMVVPWKLFPGFLTDSKARVVFSMPLMLLFPSFWLPVSLGLLLSLVIAELLSRLAGLVSGIWVFLKEVWVG